VAREHDRAYGPRVTSYGSFAPTAAFAVLIALTLYLRLRRTFGRQAVRPTRMIVRMALLSLVAGVMLLRVPASALVGPLAGALVGGTLAFVDLASTRFETSADGVSGRFYTPNKWIGLGVTALFLGRLASRLVSLQSVMAQAQTQPNGIEALSKNPFTFAVFFVMATYYVVYYAGVLRRSRMSSDRYPSGAVARPPIVE
jgi:hypothetical protein